MENANNILGKKPKEWVIEKVGHILENIREEGIGVYVEKVFNMEYILDLTSGGIIGGDNSNSDGIIRCLEGLPVNHRLVEEILKRANITLERAQKMSALELRVMTYPPDEPQTQHTPYNTQLVIAFDICDAFNPESLFNNMKLASYHVINEHILHPIELPDDEQNQEPVWSAVRAFTGYYNSHPKESLEFAEFLDRNKLYTAYVLRLYANLGNERAITSFIKALRENREDIDFKSFKFLAKKIKQSLTKRGFIEEDFKDFNKYVSAINDTQIREK